MYKSAYTGWTGKIDGGAALAAGHIKVFIMEWVDGVGHSARRVGGRMVAAGIGIGIGPFVDVFGKNHNSIPNILCLVSLLRC